MWHHGDTDAAFDTPLSISMSKSCRFEKGTLARHSGHKIHRKRQPAWVKVLRAEGFSYGGQWKRWKDQLQWQNESTIFFLSVCMCMVVSAWVYACVHSCWDETEVRCLSYISHHGSLLRRCYSRNVKFIGWIRLVSH